MTNVLIGALLAGMVATGSSAQTITDAPAFNGVVAALHKVALPTDKFAEPVKLTIEGKPFKLTLAATDDIQGDGGLRYDYVDGVLTLDVSPTTVWPGVAGVEQALPALLVSSTTKNLGSSLAQNAYGAVAEVHSYLNTGAAVAIVSGPKPMLSPSNTDHHYDNLENTDWWVRLTLPPAQARAVAMDAVAIVEGTFVSLPTGKAGACHMGGSSATIDHPSSYRSEVCYVGANVTRIALMRRSSGEVIKEWTLENSPHLGPVLWGNIRVGMNTRELAAAEPTITSYGYVETGQVQVEMTKQAVSSVQVRDWPARGKALAKLLTARYGQPLQIDCAYDATCEGKWAAGEGIVAYMSIMGWVTFQPTDAKPPAGFLAS